jgi:hypothetical protein
LDEGAGTAKVLDHGGTGISQIAEFRYNHALVADMRSLVGIVGLFGNSQILAHIRQPVFDTHDPPFFRWSEFPKQSKKQIMGHIFIL